MVSFNEAITRAVWRTRRVPLPADDRAQIAAEVAVASGLTDDVPSHIEWRMANAIRREAAVSTAATFVDTAPVSPPDIPDVVSDRMDAELCIALVYLLSAGSPATLLYVLPSSDGFRSIRKTATLLGRSRSDTGREIKAVLTAVRAVFTFLKTGLINRSALERWLNEILRPAGVPSRQARGE